DELRLADTVPRAVVDRGRSAAGLRAHWHVATCLQLGILDVVGANVNVHQFAFEEGRLSAVLAEAALFCDSSGIKKHWYLLEGGAAKCDVSDGSLRRSLVYGRLMSRTASPASPVDRVLNQFAPRAPAATSWLFLPASVTVEKAPSCVSRPAP